MTQLNRFDLNLLLVFDANTGRVISRAAERLNVTRSAVIHALSRVGGQLPRAGPALDFGSFAELDHVIASTNSRGKTLKDDVLRAVGRPRAGRHRSCIYLSPSLGTKQSDMHVHPENAGIDYARASAREKHAERPGGTCH